MSSFERSRNGFTVTHTRRRLLQAGVAGVVVASAGCAGVLDDDSDEGSDDSDGTGEGDGSVDGDETDGETGADPPADAPSVVFDFEEHDEELVITHDGGDSLDPENVDIRGPVGDWIPTSDTVEVGDRITLLFETRAQSGDTVELVWIDPDGGDETLLGEHTISG